MVCPTPVVKAFREIGYEVTYDSDCFTVNNSQYLSNRVALDILKKAGIGCPIVNKHRLSSVQFAFIPLRIPSYFYHDEVPARKCEKDEVWGWIFNIPSVFFEFPSVILTGFVALPVVEFLAPDVKKGKALDLGSGSGTNAIPLHKFGWTVTCVDIDYRALRPCKDLPIECLNADMLRLDMPKEHYDLILAIDSLPYISPKKWKEMLTKIWDALVPGGHFIGSFYVKQGPKYPKAHVLPHADLIIPMLSDCGFRKVEFYFRRYYEDGAYTFDVQK